MNTETLIATSRARFEHATAKRTLKEKYQGKLTFAHQGGLFKATPELITFLATCKGTNEIVLLDLYDNPVNANVIELTRIATELYHEQMNAWFTEYEQLSKNR